MFQNVLAQTKPIGSELLAAQYISGGVQIFTLNSFSFGIQSFKRSNIVRVYLWPKYHLTLYGIYGSSSLTCNYDNAELHITPIVQV